MLQFNYDPGKKWTLFHFKCWKGKIQLVLDGWGFLCHDIKVFLHSLTTRNNNSICEKKCLGVPRLPPV